MKARLKVSAGNAIVWVGAAALFLLAGLLWLDWGAGMEGEAPKAAIIAAPSLQPELRLPDPPSPEAYKAFNDKPLFHPSRRPFPERSAVAAALAPAPPPPPRVLTPPQGLTLKGTVISGPFRSAVFERMAQKDYVRIGEGEELQGWTLAKVSRSGIVLKAAGQELSMKLEANPR